MILLNELCYEHICILRDSLSLLFHAYFSNNAINEAQLVSYPGQDTAFLAHTDETKKGACALRKRLGN